MEQTVDKNEEDDDDDACLSLCMHAAKK